MTQINTPQTYEVTRLFIGGTLEGLTYTNTTTIVYEVGWECLKPVGGSPYRIIEVKPVSGIAVSVRELSDC